jgi:transposase
MPNVRTSISLQGIIQRNTGLRVNVNQVKKVKTDEVLPLLAGQEDLELSGRVSKEAIDFLTGKIPQIEITVQKKVKLKKAFKHLPTIPGVGKILSLTIMLETGPIKRFAKVGDYVSYCRKVPTSWTSNGKRKGNLSLN